jgi:flagellar hook-length control protein FliK
MTGPSAAFPTTAPQQSANVTPADVASQIVHQADLFRLPGNRGVRIQLHPEDLGGVQVTLRYAGNSGGLELHINVEHATTGALVEAGWGQLRDALASQGISPDRLVMSITGPHNATGLDLSSNGGGAYRQDQALTSFTQNGQSGQQRSDGGAAEERGTSRAWDAFNNTSPDPSSDDISPVANAAAATRIDYRV